MTNLYSSVGYFIDKCLDDVNIQINNTSNELIWAGKAQEFNWNSDISDKQIRTFTIGKEVTIVINKR